MGSGEGNPDSQETPQQMDRRKLHMLSQPTHLLILILPADKVKATVTLDREDSGAKLDRLLSDT